MKKIEAIVDSSQLDEVRASLDRVGVEGMTVIEVRGYERESGRTELYRGVQHEVFLVTRVKVEIVVEDGRAPALLEQLARVARAGKIVVLPLEDPERVRRSV